MTSSVVLASASPRRRRLLGRLGIAFDIVVSNIDEDLPGPLPVTALVRELALRKAQVVAGTRMTGVVLGADTAVAIDARVLGKPADGPDAARMLRLLRGRRHTVATGVAVVDLDRGREVAEVALTRVTMRDYTDDEIAVYVASGEPLGKAGGYAIQGAGGALVAEVDGRLDTVVGLPLDVAARLLGIDRW